MELKQDDAYAEEDEGEGRSISEYEQWQAGDIEEGRTFFGPHTPSRTLIGRRRESLESVDVDSIIGTGERTGLLSGAPADRGKKRRLFGRGEWNVGRVLFFVWFYFIIGTFSAIDCDFRSRKLTFSSATFNFSFGCLLVVGIHHPDG